MLRSASVVSLTAALGELTVRAAFSHIPLAQSTLWMVDNILMKAAPGNIMTGTTTASQVPKPQVCANSILDLLLSNRYNKPHQHQQAVTGFTDCHKRHSRRASTCKYISMSFCMSHMYRRISIGCVILQSGFLVVRTVLTSLLMSQTNLHVGTFGLHRPLTVGTWSSHVHELLFKPAVPALQ